ncbi:MAG TPA: hypothetical protein VGG28_28770 [Kofleriaceae bacterium]|jgi:hypothetical protein
MAARAFGALLALLAALLFAAALAGALLPRVIPAWWDGHPRIGDKTFEHKEIHVGLIGAYGCNLGETVECEPLETGMLIRPLGLAELAALGLVMLTTIALLVSTWTFGERRRGLARIAMIEALIAAAIAGAWFALGPDIKAGAATVNVPIGLGMYAFGGALVAVFLASLIAPHARREPLRLKTSRRMPAPAAPIPPTPDPLADAAFDVNDLLPLRPSQSAIPPTPAFQAQFASSNPLTVPTGTGPHQPLVRHTPLPPQLQPMIEATTGPPSPLFENAPQLRPLYDMANIGVVPAPPPPRLPERPPTPIPRASINETTEVPRAVPAPVPPVPMPTTTAITPSATPRTKAASLPPIAPRPPPSRTAQAMGSAVPERVSKQPTIATAVPPMPAAPAVRAETDHEPETAVEVDAEAKAKWQAAQARKPVAPTKPPAPAKPPAKSPAPTKPMVSPKAVAPPPPPAPAAADTDENPVAPAPDTEQFAVVATPPVLEGPTAVDPAFADTMLPPANMSPAVTVDKADFDRSLDRNPPPHRPSAPALKPPQIAVPKTIAPKPMPSAHARAPIVEAPRSESTKIPLSTAPASLPPPKQAQPATSGPTPACPQCEAPMAWVEEHLRFYCKQCRMYF